jgi:hypothetical protein
MLWYLLEFRNLLIDLSRLVTLQSVILDTKESLSGIVREIDKTLEGDVASVLVSSLSLNHIFLLERILAHLPLNLI